MVYYTTLLELHLKIFYSGNVLDNKLQGTIQTSAEKLLYSGKISLSEYNTLMSSYHQFQENCLKPENDEITEKLVLSGILLYRDYEIFSYYFCANVFRTKLNCRKFR